VREREARRDVEDRSYLWSSTSEERQVRERESGVELAAAECVGAGPPPAAVEERREGHSPVAEGEKRGEARAAGREGRGACGREKLRERAAPNPNSYIYRCLR